MMTTPDITDVSIAVLPLPGDGARRAEERPQPTLGAVRPAEQQLSQVQTVRASRWEQYSTVQYSTVQYSTEQYSQSQ